MIREEHLDVYDLKLTVKAPLFIGSGKVIPKKEYAFLSREITKSPSAKVMLFDESKFFRLLVDRNLVDKYEMFMLGAQTDLLRFLSSECKLSIQDIRAVSRSTVDVGDALDEDHSLKEINAFIRNGKGEVYIPGSSIKGALRTAILTDMILNDGKKHSAYDMSDKGFEGKYLNTLGLRKDRDGRTMNDAVNSILSGVRISDSTPVADSAMMLAGKIDADCNGQTHKINLCRECIKPGTKIHFTLTLDRSVVKNKITREYIMECINGFERFYEEVWLKMFDQPYNAANVSYDSCLLLGGGAGYISKTVTYPYLGEDDGLDEVIQILSRNFRKHKHEQDVNVGISPRMDKYAQYLGKLYPYGLCEVSIT